MPTTNRRIVLASRPEGPVLPEHFRLEAVAVPDIRQGEVLVRNQFLSLDPYMRGRIGAQKTYAAQQDLNETMIGGTTGTVMMSRHPDYKPGDAVIHMGGWQEISVARPDIPPPPHSALETGPQTLAKLPADPVSPSVYLGPAGMPGITAWYSVNSICRPTAGETMVVSAAAGAVGGIVGQIAKRNGCRVVGLAGGPDKCQYVINELGFDACIDYRAYSDAQALNAELKRNAPNGVDTYHDNVGGGILNVVLSQMNANGRVAICGVISRYAKGASPVLTDLSLVLRSRLQIQGFIIMEHPEIWGTARSNLIAALLDKTIRFRESVAHGLEAAPAAFIGMMEGRNVGKQIVQL